MQPPRLSELITVFGTIVFYDEITCELKHGDQKTSPKNLKVNIQNEKLIIEIIKDPVRYIFWNPNSSIIVSELEHDATHFVIEGVDEKHFGLKTIGYYLCAEPSGKITLDRTKFDLWETFSLREIDTKNNTLNICLGHEPFPRKFSKYVDIALSPFPIDHHGELIVVDDKIYGEDGQALSEYSQLFWLYNNYDQITDGFDYIRIFQYRRFLARENYGQQSSLPWARQINESQIELCENEFNRFCREELIGSPVQFEGGILQQYAGAHILSDLLLFCHFLLETNVFNTENIVKFLQQQDMIPSCNMGIYTKTTLYQTLKTLEHASNFLNSNYFKKRTGYQRRNVGFLLERLNSFILLERIRNTNIPPRFGHQIIISESSEISTTKEIFQYP